MYILGLPYCFLKGKMMSYTRKISETTKKLLYANSGNSCAMCNATLILDNSSNASEICHIEAVNEDGARYNPNLTDEYVNSYENLILLCPRCHTIVDDKQNIQIYSVEFLKRLKHSHENLILDTMNNSNRFDPSFFISDIPISKKIVEFLQEFSLQDIQNGIKSIVYAQPVTQNLLFAIICMCHLNKNDYIDTLMLKERTGYEDYDFAQTLMVLEQMGYIEETRYTGELDGYEDQNGDYHLVKNDYFFKAGQGDWYLNKLGKLLMRIREYLNSADLFYELVCQRNVDLLR